MSLIPTCPDCLRSFWTRRGLRHHACDHRPLDDCARLGEALREIGAALAASMEKELKVLSVILTRIGRRFPGEK